MVYILKVCYAAENLCMCSIHKTLQKIPFQNNSSHSSLKTTKKPKNSPYSLRYRLRQNPLYKPKINTSPILKSIKFYQNSYPNPLKTLINKAFSRTPLIPKHFHHISNLTLLSQITHHHPSTLPSTSKTSLL